jgi:hypothetical protein
VRIDPRPRDVGRLLDDALVLYRENLRSILIVALVVIFPVSLLWGLASSTYYSFIFTPEFFEPAPAAEAPDAAFVWMLVLQALIYLVVPIRWAANSFVSSTLFTASPELMAGAHPGVRSLAKTGLRRWLSVAAVLLMVGFIVGAVGLVAYIAALFLLIPLALVATAAPWLVLVGFALGVLGFSAIFLYVRARLAVAAPAAAAETGNPIAAMGRTWTLTRGRVWRTILFFLGVWMLSSALRTALYALGAALLVQPFTQALQSPEAFNPQVPLGVTVALGVLLALAETVVVPFDRLCYSQLYVDLRARGEGMDLMVRARELAGSDA